MKQINKHINQEDFRRYLDNQMTLAERNLFERELQKHPFEAEALEGFQNIKPIQFQKDLNELKNIIHPEKHKNIYRYWAAAASFLLIVASGLIWFQLSEKSPFPKMTENKTEQKQEEKLVTPNIQKEIISESAILQPQPSVKNIQAKSKVKMEEDEIVYQPKKSKEVLKPEPINVTETTENDKEIIVENVFENDINLKKLEVEPTRKISAARGNSQPKDSNVLIIVEGVQNIRNVQPTTSKIVSYNVHTAEDFSDSFADVQSVSELPEVAAPKSTAKMGSEILIDSKVQPEIGMPEFKEYLKNEAVLPNDFPKRKEAVKLLLKINTSGEISEFQNQNKTDSLLFEQAKEIIRDGPKWQTEIKNGIPIESEIEIKIIFRK